MSNPPAIATASGAYAAAAIQSGATWEQATLNLLNSLSIHDPPDLALLFVDSRFSEHYAEIVGRVHQETGARYTLGCTGQAVIGPGVEAEHDASISLLTFSLPDAQLTPVAFVTGHQPEEQLERIAGADAETWLCFADPFSVHTEQLVDAVTIRAPSATLLGGMASAHNQAAGTAVFLNGAVYDRGAVLIGLRGVRVHALVAQGAEPIGQPWTITDCAANQVRGIGFRPALEVLNETLAALDPATRGRAQRNLLVGLAMNEYHHSHGRGDFLIRNLIGADRESGALAINAQPQLGQTFQFQFRDAAAADEDLRAQLTSLRAQLSPDEIVLGAVLCACNGRGEGLFGVPHHDAQALAEMLGPVPTAGLLCSGEIGPVGGKTFLHGFTASIAVFTAQVRQG